MEKNFPELIEKAANVASRSPNRLRHGVLILDSRGRILSYGFNYGYTHAEVDAFRKLPALQRRGHIVFSVRLTQSGEEISTAKPCPACQKVLRRYNTRKVYYTTRERKVEVMRFE